MKILILGATGRTGKLVLSAALESGDEVHCLVRDSQKVTPSPNLMIFEGDTTSSKDLADSMEGCEAVISVLNISRTSDFPWAPVRSPHDLLSKTMSNVIAVANDLGIKRVSICSAWGANESLNDIPFWFKAMIRFSNIGVAFKDHERQENLLKDSELDWTIVRPVGLSNSSAKEEIQESYDNQPKPNLLISRKSTANFLLESIRRNDLKLKTVTICKSN